MATILMKCSKEKTDLIGKWKLIRNFFSNLLSSGSVSRKHTSNKRFIEDTSSVNGDAEMADFVVDDVASEKSFRSGTSRNVMAAPKAKAPKEPKQAVTIIQGYTPEIQTAFQPNASGVDEKRRYLGTHRKGFLLLNMVLMYFNIAWNTTGSVVARYDDASTNIEVEFSDQSAHKNFSMNKGIRITYVYI